MRSSFASIFAVTDSKQSSSSSEYSLKMRQKLQDILPRKSMVREYHTNTIFLSLQILSWWWIKIIILVVNDRVFTLHKYLCIYTRVVGRGNYKGSLILSEDRNSDQICMWDRGGGPRGCKGPKQQSLLKS